MAKTVDINQLFVLVSALVGVELFGVVGALLAIPAAGVIQVIVRDLWDHRAGKPKDEPTIGTDETPVSEVVRDTSRETVDDETVDEEEPPPAAVDEPAVEEAAVGPAAAEPDEERPIPVPE